MLDVRAGEISRELRGTRVAHRAEDNGDAVLDWPFLPSRRRVWERVLRVLDRSGMAGALRTQMAVALESARLVAGKPLGHAVPADFLYTRFADDAFAAGELPEETRARITKLREGSEPERLQARVLMLVYMLGLIQGDAEFHGVRATAETLADLLIENLEAGGDFAERCRRRLPRWRNPAPSCRSTVSGACRPRRLRSGTPPIAPNYAACATIRPNSPVVVARRWMRRCPIA